MAQFDTRTITYTRHEWVLPNGHALAEFDKARSTALQYWESVHPGERITDDSVRVTGDDGQVILYFETEEARGT